MRKTRYEVGDKVRRAWSLQVSSIYIPDDRDIVGVIKEIDGSDLYIDWGMHHTEASRRDPRHRTAWWCMDADVELAVPEEEIAQFDDSELCEFLTAMSRGQMNGV